MDRVRRHLALIMIFTMILSSCFDAASYVSFGASETVKLNSAESAESVEAGDPGDNAAPDDVEKEDADESAEADDAGEGGGSSRDSAGGGAGQDSIKTSPGAGGQPSASGKAGGRTAKDKKDKNAGKSVKKGGSAKAAYRDLKVVITEDEYTEKVKTGKYAGRIMPTYSFSCADMFLRSLTGADPDLPGEEEIKKYAGRKIPVSVSVAGSVPEGVYAEAVYTELGSRNKEKADTDAAAGSNTGAAGTAAGDNSASSNNAGAAGTVSGDNNAGGNNAGDAAGSNSTASTGSNNTADGNGNTGTVDTAAAAAQEQSLFAVRIILRDRKGDIYVPGKGEKLDIKVSGIEIEKGSKGESSLILYAISENISRSEEYTDKYKSMLAGGGDGAVFAADVLAFEEQGFDDARRLYEDYDEKKKYRDGEDAVRFRTIKNSLTVKQDTVSLTYDSRKGRALAGSRNGGKDEHDGALTLVARTQKPEEEGGAGSEGRTSEQAGGEDGEDSDAENESADKADEDDQDSAASDEEDAVKKDDEKKAGRGSAKEQTLTAEDGKKYRVAVTYDSAAGIPDNAELQVSWLKQKSAAYKEYVGQAAETLGKTVKNLEFAHALDISLVDPATGEHYQPNKDVKVSIELLKEDIASSDRIGVVHFTEETDDETAGASEDSAGGKAEILDARVTSDGAIEFESGSFSIYIVTRDALLKHYVFLNGTDNSSDIFAEQVLTDGESLVEPAMPSRSGAVFDHWEDASHNTAVFPLTVSTADAQGETLDEKQEWLDANKVYYYAVYSDEKTVITYYNQSGLVVEKHEVEKPAAGQAAAEEDTRSVRYLPIQDKEGSVVTFRYWTDDPRGNGHEVGTETAAGSGEYDGVIKITADSPSEIELYPKLEDGHYLYLDNNRKAYDLSNADFIQAETVVDGETANEVLASLNERSNHAIPEAPGYVFKGWYISASKTKFEEDQLVPVFKPNADGTALVMEQANISEYNKLLNQGVLPNNPTLYAHWEPNPASTYTVIFWTQKLTEDGKSAMVPNSAEGIKLDDCYSYQGSFTFAADTDDEKTLSDAGNDRKIELGIIQNCDLSSLGDLEMYNRVFEMVETDKENNPFYGFTYNAGKSDASVTVKPDGSTVMNIRYDRNNWTLTFVEYTYTRDSSGGYYNFPGGYIKSGSNYIYYAEGYYERGSSEGPYSGNVSNNSTQSYYKSQNGYAVYATYTLYRYRRSTAVLATINAPYGALIKDRFPNTADPGRYDGYSWDPYPKNTYKYVLATVETMPNENVTFAHAGGGTAKTVYYYIEVDEEDSDGTTFGNKHYKLYKTAKHNYSFITYDEEYHPITGYTRDYSHADPAFDSSTKRAEIGAGNINRLYYERSKYYINYYDPLTSTSSAIKTEEILFKQSVGNKTDSYSPTARNGYKFTGWYMDPSCKIRLCTSQEEYDSYTPDTEAGESKELLESMPARNIQLYAGWMVIRNRAVLIPNGGDMSGQGVQFHLEADEKISPSDPTRDYVPADSGAYVYDDVYGTYDQTEDGASGQYASKSGAYVFQGWYEVDMSDETPVLVEYKRGKYTYAYGSYQMISDGAKDRYTKNKYTKNSDNSYSLDENGEYVFVDREPTEVGADHKIKRSHGVEQKFDLDSAPNEPVVLVAMWQRAGGFRVVYNVKDPALTGLTDDDYRGVTAPEDPEEYIDNSHAVVWPAVAAPKGYTLDCWKDKNGNTYKPNELIAVNEHNASLQGSEMIVTLTAHYREYEPIERDMADYTFMTNVNSSGTGFDSSYSVYELQKIAVNEELKAPITPPAPEGYSFRGWYLDAAGTRVFNGFGRIANPTYTTLYAKFDRVFTVNYYLTDSSTRIKTDTVIASQTYRDPGAVSSDSEYEKLDTRHITHPVDLDHYVVMWVSDWDHQDVEANQYLYNTASSRPVKSNMNLYAVLRERSYVKFDSCGGTFVNQQEIPYGSWPSRPKDPTKEGFEFLGWYTKKTGGTEYGFDRKLSEIADYDGTLYARWKGDSSKRSTLHVIFWAQTPDRPDNADNDKEHYQMLYRYELSTSYGDHTRDELRTELAQFVDNGQYDMVKTVNTARSANAPEVATFIEDALGYKGTNADIMESWDPSAHIGGLDNYYSFSEKSDSSVTVDSKGDAVLNIRFDLKEFYLEFVPQNKAEIHYGGRTHPANGTENYRIKVWLNKPIADQWPVDKTDNIPQSDDPAYMKWLETGTAFQSWVMSFERKYKYNSTSGTYLDANNANEEHSTPLSLSDMLIIDTIRLKGSDCLASKKLTLTPKASSATDLKTAVVHYLTLIDNTNVFRELEDMRTEIKVPELDSWNIPTGTCFSGSGNYARYTSSICRTVGPEHAQNEQTPFNHPVESGKYLYSYNLLEPVSLSGYTILENEHAHSGDLFNPDGTPDDGDGNNGLNKLKQFNLISNRIAYAEVIFQKDDPSSATYDNYFSDHPDQFDERTGVYNMYYYFRPIGYKLSFYTDPSSQLGAVSTVYRGTDISSVITSYTRELNEKIADGTVKVPEGTQFGGWATAPFVTDSSKKVTGGEMSAHDLNLYAIWKPLSYTVTTVGVDKDEDGSDDTYTAAYGQQLRELNIPNPRKEGKLFRGWLNDATGTSVTGVYAVKCDIRIKPEWLDLETRKILYETNFPDPLLAPFGTIDKATNTIIGPAEGPSAPVDTNSYVLGTRAVIHNGGLLYINRKDVDGKYYRAGFAYWEDSEGNRYYPNTSFTFRSDSRGLKTIDGVKTLVLKAVYSEYRETSLVYDRNVEETDESAKFVEADEDWEPTEDPYPDDDHKFDQVTVLFRDRLEEDFGSYDMIPNQTFPIGTDQHGGHFTVIREDEFGNSFIFAGWGTDKDNGVVLGKNGDKAYVNTIRDDEGELRNTLYAIWGVCKVKDRYGVEHVFDTIQKAANFINTTRLLEPEKTGKIEMLIDYNKPNRDGVNGRGVTIPSGCDITLTTAKPLSEASLLDGTTYYYIGANSTAQAVKPYAVITRAENGASMFVNSGALTLEKIIIDGGKGNSKKATLVNENYGAEDVNGGIVRNSVSGAELTVKETTTLRYSAADGNGGAIYNAGKVTMVEDPDATDNTRGSLEHCSAADGGAIYNAAGGTVDMSGGYIANCTASGNGGGIYTESTGSAASGKGAVNLHSDSSHPGIIDSCSANKGGGIYLAAGELDMSGGEIEKCSASNGGGIYAAGGTTLKLDEWMNSDNKLLRGSIEQCTATANGGGIYIETGATVTMHGGSIEYCTAVANGGGIYNGGTFTMTNTNTAASTSDGAQPGVIDSCSARNGGGIFLGAAEDSTVAIEISGGTIQNCSATINGGAIYDNSRATIMLTGVTINGHQDLSRISAGTKNARQGGGIYLPELGERFSSLDITNCDLYNLTAEQGGAIFSNRRSNEDGSSSTGCNINISGGVINGHYDVFANSTEPNAYNGGMLYLGNGSVDIKNGTSIYNCTVSGSGDPGNNNNAGSGGVIFNVGNGHPYNDGSKPTVALTGVTTNGHYDGYSQDTPNANNGGAIFMKMATLSLTNCTLRNLTVGEGTSGGGKGAALFGYTNGGGNTPSEFTITGSTITANKASGADGGAINVVSGSTVSSGASGARSSTVTFGGDAVVYDNLNGGDQANMVLETDPLNDNNAVVRTTESGLGVNAHVGVYVAGTSTAGSETDPYASHGMPNKPFGTMGTGDAGTYLFHFTNDRNVCWGVKRGDDGLIYWNDSLVKITDKDNNLLYQVIGGAYLPAVYELLTDAVGGAEGTLYKLNGDEYTAAADMSSSELRKMKMLRDYMVPETDKVLMGDTDNIVLTTAENETEAAKAEVKAVMEANKDAFIYVPAAGAEGDRTSRATITRGSGGEAMITVSGKVATTNIIFDGNGTAYAKNNGGQNDPQTKAMIAAKNSGSLTLDDGTVIQNAKLGLGNYYGAAIYIGDSATVTMNDGSKIKDCLAREGSAIYQQSGTFTMNTGAEINNCNGYKWGGAVRMNGGTMNLNGGKIKDSSTGISSSDGRGGAVCNNGGTLNIGEGFEISGCSAYLGGAVYAGAATNITGGTITNCYAANTGGAVHMNGNTSMSGGTISNCYAGTSGGGIHRGGGELRITGTAQITNCIAPKGGGIYTGWLLIETTGTRPVISGCEAKDVTINADGTVTTASSYTDGNFGGAIYASGGITVNSGTITSNAAYYGGAIYSVGGMNINGGTITSSTANTGGGVYLSGGESSIKADAQITGCSADIGAGVFAANGTADDKRTRIRLEGATITGNTAAIKGGGIAFGGDYTKAIFKNSVSVQDNHIGSGSGAVECNVYLDRDSNTIIESQGLTATAHRFIGVYVPDDAIGETTLNQKHGVRGTPFGTFTGNNDRSLSCFVNDRDPILYGVSKISDSNDKKIYWVDFICKITDKNGNLLYRDSAKTKPAVYGKLDGNLIGTAENPGGDADSAFAKLSINDPMLYGSGDSTTANLYDTNGKYTSNEYCVKMLVDEYTTSRWILAPEGRKITFTTATKDSRKEDGYPYQADARTDHAVIKRGDSTTASAMITAKGDLILENITLDGGAVLNNGTFTGLSCIQGGSIVCLQYNATLRVKSGATLQNSFNGVGDKSEKRGGGAISNREKGSNANKVYIESGAVIQNCGTNGWGGAIALKQGKLEMSGGTIRNCYAFKHSSEAKSGLGGAIHYWSADGNNPTKVYLSGGTISNCHAEKSGGGISIETDKSKLYLSGDPSFSNNTVAMTGYADKENGGEKVYTATDVRQDIHIPAKNGVAPYIEITGNLGSAAGSIWVWAETDGNTNWQHYKENQQFAVLASGVDAETITGLTAFRNAQDDEATANTTSSYLTGVMHDDNNVNVYWGTDITGSRKVILRKVDSANEPVKDMIFKVYKGSAASPYIVKNGTTRTQLGGTTTDATVTVDPMKSLDSGVFWIGDLPYGWYIVEETGAAPKYFFIVVTAKGTYGTIGTNGENVVDGYSSRATAEDRAKAVYDAKK